MKCSGAHTSATTARRRAPRSVVSAMEHRQRAPTPAAYPVRRRLHAHLAQGHVGQLPPEGLVLPDPERRHHVAGEQLQGAEPTVAGHPVTGVDEEEFAKFLGALLE
ncbi:MAG: hypothetical protein HYZ72_10855 [Deltaproteobacteria bacterium]|nr:hypothetical protein [Deltaproteobacteria bacterium]